MDPTYKQIADLFGLSLPTAEETAESLPRKSKGETADESIELGGHSLIEGDYEKAITHFKRAIEQSGPGDVKGRVSLAAAYETAEMAPQALRQYETALRAQQNEPEPYLGLSQIYKRQARYKDSLERLRLALELEPNNAFYHFKMAEILREINEREGALDAIQRAVTSAPADSFYHYWAGDLLVDMKRYDEALDFLRAALELSPGDDYLYLRTAAAFWGAGKRQEAVKAVRLASDLDPDKHLYHGVLELFLSEMELNEEADLEAERCSQMDEYDRDQLRRFADGLGLDV